MKSSDEEEVHDVDDGVSDENLTDEGAGWGETDANWSTDQDEITEKTKLTRHSVEGWHERRRIECEHNDLLN